MLSLVCSVGDMVVFATSATLPKKSFFNPQEECNDQITSWLRHFEPEVVSVCSDNSVSGRINSSITETSRPVGLVIDGRTLMYALEESLNQKFLDLAKRCQVVLCCRATPSQKVGREITDNAGKKVKVNRQMNTVIFNCSFAKKKDFKFTLWQISITEFLRTERVLHSYRL